MFTVHVSGHPGVEAEFVVPSAVEALDLVLRSARAGLAWRCATGGMRRGLSLSAMYHLAVDAASDQPGHAQHLRDAAVAERRALAARLN